MMASRPSSLVPKSVLRQSGSSNCLRARSESGELPQSESSRNLFTITHTEELPNYSAERYYCISELQLKAHSISFLSEWDAGENYNTDHQTTDGSHATMELSLSSGDASTDIVVVEERIKDGDEQIDNSRLGSTDNNSGGQIAENDGIQRQEQQTRHLHDSKLNLPPCVILYLLWRYDSPHFESPELFAKHYIRTCVQRIRDAYETIEGSMNADGTTREARVKGEERSEAPHIYIMIDRVCSGDSLNKDSQDQIVDYNNKQIALTKELLQIVATSQTMKLRSIVEGITVGISTSVRAAPGLEQCMNAIMVGDSERRSMIERDARGRATANSTKFFTGGKWTMDDPQASCIAIIADHPDDLLGLDPTMEADSVQGMQLHLRMYSEWCRGGNVLNFAARSQKLWRSCLLKGRGEKTTSTTDDELDQIFTGKRSHMSHRKRRQQHRKPKPSCASDRKRNSENISNIMVAFFLAFMYAQIWKHFGENLKDIGSFILKTVQDAKVAFGF